MSEPPLLKIYGPTISTYVRIVQTVAEEAGLPFETIATPTGSPENVSRHPFGRSPAVELEGEVIYESVAIAQLIDDRFNGSALQPKDAMNRARMSQWLSIANTYIFPATEEGLVAPRLLLHLHGHPPREDIIEEALPGIAYYLAIVSKRLEETPFLAGPDLSLADLFMFVILRAVQMTPEGEAILGHLLPLKAWMGPIGKRPSIRTTQWPGEV